MLNVISKLLSEIHTVKKDTTGTVSMEYRDMSLLWLTGQAVKLLGSFFNWRTLEGARRSPMNFVEHRDVKGSTLSRQRRTLNFLTMKCFTIHWVILCIFT